MKNEKNVKETFGERVLRLLKEQDISQKDFAQDIGATESAVSKYISDDRTPRMEILANMATALGVTVDYLVTGKENEDKIPFTILTRNIENLNIEQQQKIITLIIKHLGGK